jgi:hypothetical protein
VGGRLDRLLRRGPGQRLRYVDDDESESDPAARALDASLTLTGPSTVARFNANGTQGAAGASSLSFTTRGVWDGLEVVRRDRDRDGQRFDGRRELT